MAPHAGNSKTVRHLTTFLAIGLLVSCASGDRKPAPSAPDPVLRLGSPFSSHMVVQRDEAVAIWGIDHPGQQVTLSTPSRTWAVRASEDGKWTTTIGPFAVGDPFALSVQGSRQIVLDDVVAGEVWLASGQSNMEFMLKNEVGGAAEVAAADQPLIRLLTIPHNGAVEPVEFVENAGWTACTPQSAATFSAVAYHFGAELHESLNVPIGLIHCSWGGASMESWTRLGAMADDPMLSFTVKQHDDWAAKAASAKPLLEAYRKGIAEWDANPPRTTRFITDPGQSVMEEGWNTIAFDDSAWGDVLIPGEVNIAMGAIDGVIAFRKAVDIPASLSGRTLTLSLGAIDDQDITYFNGVEVGRCGAETPSAATSRRKYVVPAELVKTGRNLVAVRVFDKAGVGGFRGPAKELTLTPLDDPNAAIPLNDAWKFKVMHSVPGRPSPPLPTERDVPGLLYNGMVNPLIPFRFRGVIWYQGEANTDRAEQYRHLSEVMITDWRRQFGHGDFDFHFVQLAGFGINSPGWIEIMEAQQQTLAVPRTGMAVAADIGDRGDIHPKNKKDVGHRLALVARARTYGEEITHSGPTLLQARREGSRIVATFDHVGSGLVLKTSPDPFRPSSFEVAGADGIFHPATVTIEGSALRIVSDRVAQPATVRYAWRNFPTCELYNKEGLPAPPFRSTLTAN
jgi:sialate O-acetylesterase